MISSIVIEEVMVEVEVAMLMEEDIKETMIEIVIIIIEGEVAHIEVKVTIEVGDMKEEEEEMIIITDIRDKMIQMLIDSVKDFNN
jgi:hypothetical protein